jgi:hypothetical protein
MLDGHFPTGDGRELVFCPYTQPEKGHKMLLAQLGWELPPQSPSRATQIVRPSSCESRVKHHGLLPVTAEAEKHKGRHCWRPL